MLSVAPWPYRDVLSCLICQFVSLFQLPEQYITLAVLCLPGCVCAADAPEPTEAYWDRSSQWSSLWPQHNSETSHREEVVYCVLDQWRSFCLAVTSVRVTAGEQRGKARGWWLRLYSSVETQCLVGDCSFHLVDGYQCINYKTGTRGPQGSLLLIFFSLNCRLIMTISTFTPIL